MVKKLNRLNFVVTDKTKDMLDDLVERSDSSNMTEVVRRALSLYDSLTNDLENKNNQLVLRRLDCSGSIVEEEIIRII